MASKSRSTSSSTRSRGTTLFSPGGESYTTSDPAEITRLKTAHGYSTKKPTASSTSRKAGGSRQRAASSSSTTAPGSGSAPTETS